MLNGGDGGKEGLEHQTCSAMHSTVRYGRLTYPFVR